MWRDCSLLGVRTGGAHKLGRGLRLVSLMLLGACASNDALSPAPPRAFEWELRDSICASTEGGESSLDVLLLIDTTGSMGPAIRNLQDSLGDMVDGIRALQPHSRFAVAHYEDFDEYTDRPLTDDPYKLLTPLTSSTDDIRTALDSLTLYPDGPAIGGGGDWKESGMEALYQAVTGEGLDLNKDGVYDGPDDIVPSPVGWDAKAAKVVVLVADAVLRDPHVGDDAPLGSHGSVDVHTAASIMGIKIAGISVEGSMNSAREQMITLAQSTHAVAASGYDADGDGNHNGPGDLKAGAPLIFKTDRRGNPIDAPMANVGEAISELLAQAATTQAWVEIEGDVGQIEVTSAPAQANLIYGEDVCFEVRLNEVMPPLAPPEDREVTLVVREQTGRVLSSKNLTFTTPEAP